MPKIEIDKISVSYKSKKIGEVRIFSDLSFLIPNGSFTVIIGPSGSGKTTLMRAVAGLVPLEKGRILFDGINSSELKPSERNLAYIGQENTLFPKMTIYDNLAFPLLATKTPHEEIDGRVVSVAKMLGIEMFLSRKPRQLSGGQLQRAAIAKAIIKRPSLYLFDEPFSNLDPDMRREMRKVLFTIHKSLKATFFFATHDLTDAQLLADRIIVIDDGKLVKACSPSELFANPESFSLLLNDFSQEEPE